MSKLAQQPVIWILALAGLACMLLALPLYLPIGPMYGDTMLYLEAAQRIKNGQIPTLDFRTPVGPLGYYLFALGERLFPNAHPLMLAQICMLPVTIIALLPVLLDVAKRSANISLLLFLPLAIMALTPINVLEYNTYPGFDGFGTYNRHGAHLLYVLAAALIFVKDQRILSFVLPLLAISLFLLKITAFLAGGFLFFVAFVTGRLSFKTVAITALAFVIVIAGLEFYSGIISSYVNEIRFLASHNSGMLLKRFLTAGSTRLSVVLFAGVLLFVLVALNWRTIWQDVIKHQRQNSLWKIGHCFDKDWVWLGATLFAGLFFETQNTGSHAFIMMWPAILVLLFNLDKYGSAKQAIVVLIAFATVPTAASIIHKTLRASVNAANYKVLDHHHLRNMGRLLAKFEVKQRAIKMKAYYANEKLALLPLAETYQQLPGQHFYSDIDYQFMLHSNWDDAARAILKYESIHNIKFETIFSLEFANPIPWILNRKAPRHVAIGADPSRTLPPIDDKMLTELSKTDLILLPQCPETVAQYIYKQTFAKALEIRQRIQLDPCWDGFVLSGVNAATGEKNRFSNLLD